MRERGQLNNTFLIIFSDHGMRFGPIRQTSLGQLEERLPFMVIVPPPWFKQEYPELDRNLHSNLNMLSTPFDIHATLRHILTLPHPAPEVTSPSHGSSLLLPLPADRTCSSAPVPPHYCTCHHQVTLSVDDTDVVNAAKMAVNTINNRLGRYLFYCQWLELVHVRDARLLLDYSSDNPGASKASDEALYLLTFQTSPGEGLFEATVRHYDHDKHQVLGDISRINRYGKQGECISDGVLQKFCYCIWFHNNY